MDTKYNKLIMVRGNAYIEETKIIYEEFLKTKLSIH